MHPRPTKAHSSHQLATNGIFGEIAHALGFVSGLTVKRLAKASWCLLRRSSSG
jgi:hypothetical protein